MYLIDKGVKTLRYRNTSRATKTFYGVSFRPGEEHDVPGYINVPGFIRVADLPKEPPKAVKKAPELPKQPEKPAKATGAATASAPAEQLKAAVAVGEAQAEKSENISQ